MQPNIDGKIVKFDKLDIRGSTYILSSENSSIRAILQYDDDHVVFWIDGVKGYLRDIIYFQNSYLRYGNIKTFCTDYSNFYGRLVEVKSCVLPQEQDKNNTFYTWALTPQQRAFAIKLYYLPEDQNPWFGFSLPGPLPTGSTFFKSIDLKPLEINFKDYFSDNFDGQLPKVYLFEHLENSYDVLNKHYEVTKLLGYSIPDKPFYDWWNKPILCPNADLPEKINYCKDGKYTFDINKETLLEYVLHIEEKTGISDFTVTIDGYWFDNAADYLSVNKAIFKDNSELRELIDELHLKSHRVLLWMSHFALKAFIVQGSYPAQITDEMIIKGDYKFELFDYTHQGVRDYIKNVIHFMLSDDAGCLNADGIKLDLGYLTPDIGKYKFNDPSWGVGDQLRYKVNKYICDCAHSIKPDAVVSDTCIEPSIPLDVIRLNDDWYEDGNVGVWLERARKAVSVKNTVIDTDGYSIYSKKFKNYSMIAPVIGIPSFYCAKKFFHFEPISDVDYRRLNSSWNVYNHAPVTPDMDITINPEENEYYRKYAKGPLQGFYSAISINGHCLITYTEEKALVAAVKKLTVEIPVPPKLKVEKILARTWENNYEVYSFIEGFEKNKILIQVDDVGNWYRWVEIFFIKDT